jgi:CubicO group peptidase (beta-lactamase class C family)
MRILLLAFLVSTLLNCQSTEHQSGMNKHQALLEMMNQWKDEYSIPALFVLVMNHHEIIDKAIIGMKKVDENEKADFDDYFHLGSNTKAVTAFIAARLVEEDKLDWETPFFEIFPELRSESRLEYLNITLSDLLAHRAGIRAYITGEEIAQLPELEGDIISKPCSSVGLYLVKNPKKYLNCRCLKTTLIQMPDMSWRLQCWKGLQEIHGSRWFIRF